MDLRDTVVRAVTAFHVAAVRATGGRLGGKIFGMPVLVLTTTGRKSGQPRETPLTFHRFGDDIVLVASYGGSPDHPHWYKNLVANPNVKITHEGRTEERTARTATAEEKAAMWPQVVKNYRGYDQYQQKTTRDIPLVILPPP